MNWNVLESYWNWKDLIIISKNYIVAKVTDNEREREWFSAIPCFKIYFDAWLGWRGDIPEEIGFWAGFSLV